MFVNISYLNSSMMEYIDAPMPFVIGVHRDTWKKIKLKRGKDLTWVSPEITIFDIDKGQFIRKENIQNFPDAIVKSLRSNLQLVIKQSKGLPDTQLYEFWAEGTLRVKSYFHVFYLNLIDFFPRFFIPDLKQQENKFFQTETYLESIKETHYPFMKEFTKTQSFACFIEKAYKAKKEKNDVLYFIENVELLKTLGEEAIITQLDHLCSKVMNRFKHVKIELLMCFYSPR